MNELDRQAIIDDEHLRLLRIGHFVGAATAGMFAGIGFLYAGMGLVFRFAFKNMPTPPGGHPQPPPPPEFGWFIGIIGLTIAFIGITIALLRLRAAKCLRERRSRVFCLVVACTCLIEIPYGTALGVFTLSTLGRPSIRRLFGEQVP